MKTERKTMKRNSWRSNGTEKEESGQTILKRNFHIHILILENKHSLSHKLTHSYTHSHSHTHAPEMGYSTHQSLLSAVSGDSQ